MKSIHNAILLPVLLGGTIAICDGCEDRLLISFTEVQEGKVLAGTAPRQRYSFRAPKLFKDSISPKPFFN